MIGAILLCDDCLSPDGARPSTSGRASRLVSNRGGIRRVRLGRTVYGRPSAGRVYAVDLCRRCNVPAIIDSHRRRLTLSAERSGGTFVPERGA